MTAEKFKTEGVKDMLSQKLILESEKREEKSKLEIARNLLGMGMTEEQVKNATNLPMNKIKRLQKQK
ncbi:MAG: hypothetical protein FWH48_06850 [Oscillospiraceae bacterium]|nr:hypothetical protein [Oscillospiraceae bacterium]